MLILYALIITIVCSYAVTQHMTAIQDKLNRLRDYEIDIKNTNGNLSDALLSEKYKIYKDKLKNTKENAIVVLHSLEAMNRSEGVKFLGFKCESQHAIAVISAVTLVLSGVYQFASTGTVVTS
jgi:hypothetical protein